MVDYISKLRPAYEKKKYVFGNHNKVPCLKLTENSNSRAMSLNITNPKPFLKELIGTKVLIKLKFNNTSYKGVLNTSDNYFNISLTDPEEIVDGNSTKLGNDLFIRCNNVLYIQEVKE